MYAELTDPYGNSSLRHDSSSTDEGPYTLTYSGTYSLTIYSYSNDTSNGGLRLHVVRHVDGNEHCLDRRQRDDGERYAGHGPDSTNLYQFTGTAGELVYFEGLSDSPADGAIAYFYSPSNSRVTDVYVENDTQVTLPFSGTYILAVVGQSATNSSVSYSFELFDNLAPSSALVLNSEVTGTLTNPGDEAIYTFTGSIGQQIQFNGLELGSSQVATLYDPEGTSLFDSSLGNDYGPYTLTTPGAYKLVITTNGLNTGSYDFSLLDLQSVTKLQVNTTEADLTVTLSAVATEQVLVQYSTADGTATVAGGDYKPLTGLLLFAPGQTTATVDVQAINKLITSS